MIGEQLVSSLNRFLKILLRLSWLNMLFILATLAGAVILGFFPAAVSSIRVGREWMTEKAEFSVYKLFKETYKKEFVKANVIGLILMVIAGVLFANYYAILVLGAQIPAFVVFAYYCVIILYIILFVWTFPLLSYYDTKISQYFKNALIIGITKIPITILMTLLLFMILYISLKLPSLFLFFTFSLIALSNAYLSFRIFREIDKMQAQQMEEKGGVIKDI